MHIDNTDQIGSAYSSKRLYFRLYTVYSTVESGGSVASSAVAPSFDSTTSSTSTDDLSSSGTKVAVLDAVLSAVDVSDAVSCAAAAALLSAPATALIASYAPKLAVSLSTFGAGAGGAAGSVLISRKFCIDRIFVGFPAVDATLGPPMRDATLGR
jgi:hypothetical protein